MREQRLCCLQGIQYHVEWAVAARSHVLVRRNVKTVAVESHTRTPFSLTEHRCKVIVILIDNLDNLGVAAAASSRRQHGAQDPVEDKAPGAGCAEGKRKAEAQVVGATGESRC